MTSQYPCSATSSIFGKFKHRTAKQVSLSKVTFYAEPDSVNNSYHWKTPLIDYCTWFGCV